MNALGRGLAAFGALACGGSVALAAWASHGLADEAARLAGLAAAFAFGHGLALQVVGRAATRRLALAGASLLALGVVLFSGSLLGHVVAGWPTRLAPTGGLSLMLGWALLAADAVRR